jgi:hypothetical protein
MTKPTEQLIDEIVRDFTSVDYMTRAKSEVRRRLEELAHTIDEQGYERGKKEGIEEMWCLYHQETGDVFAAEREKERKKITEAFECGKKEGVEKQIALEGLSPELGEDGKLYSKLIAKCFEAPFIEVAAQYALKKVKDTAVAEAWNDGHQEAVHIDLPQAVAEAIERTREGMAKEVEGLFFEKAIHNIAGLEEPYADHWTITKKDWNEILSSLRDKHLKSK